MQTVDTKCTGIHEMMIGDHKTKIGKRRGTKGNYGMLFSFVFADSKNKLLCKAREIVWVVNHGMYSQNEKVVPINGDLFDDRIENLKLITNNRNGRPAGATDKKKRKNRETLTVQQEQQIIKMRKKSPITIMAIAEKMGLKYNQIKVFLVKAVKRGKLKPYPYIKEKMVEIDSSRDQMGVYGIFAFAKDSSMVVDRLYIGSSVKIRRRVEDHLSQLEKNVHYNKDMQEDYNSGQYYFKTALIEECDTEGDELEREGFHMRQYEFCSLYNYWVTQDINEMKPYLEKSKHKINPDNYTVTECGCWEWNMVHRSGYGKSIEVNIGGWGEKVVKWIKPHRLSYYKYKGEYPPLIRHMCDNKLCVNPDHLESGSHRENNLDRFKQFRIDFEKKWTEFNGNREKLMDHFDIQIGTVYSWERKLGLREKYPEIAAICYKSYGTEKRKEAREQERKERQEKRQEKKQKREQEERRWKQTLIDFKMRYKTTNADAALYFDLPVTIASRLLKGVNPQTAWDSPIHIDLIELVWSEKYSTGCTNFDEVMGKHAAEIVADLIKKHPESKLEVEWHTYMFTNPDDYYGVNDMIREKQKARIE